MKDLENIFRNNTDLFNQEEPPEKHFERFLRKMEQERNGRKRFSTSLFLKVAAIFIFVALSGVTGYQLHRYQANQPGLGAISPEYYEVESYYTSNIAYRINMIKKLTTVQNNNEEQQILWDELDNMDKLYRQLKKELKANPNDDRVIQAMIEYYEVKSNVLNKIFEQLYQIKQQKLYSYESAQI